MIKKPGRIKGLSNEMVAISHKLDPLFDRLTLAGLVGFDRKSCEWWAHSNLELDSYASFMNERVAIHVRTQELSESDMTVRVNIHARGRYIWQCYYDTSNNNIPSPGDISEKMKMGLLRILYGK